jgi:hypothetical protein
VNVDEAEQLTVEERDTVSVTEIDLEQVGVLVLDLENEAENETVADGEWVCVPVVDPEGVEVCDVEYVAELVSDEENEGELDGVTEIECDHVCEGE